MSIEQTSPTSTAVTVVTVTYGDRLRYLAESVRRALEDEGVGRVLIVSNASNSPFESLEQQWGDRIHIVRLTENTGSANGYYIGIKAALDEGAEYLWLMDDDNAPSSGALQALLTTWQELSATRRADDFALLSFRPSRQVDFLAGFPLDHVFPRPGEFSGFHLLDIPNKLWSRTRWGKPTPPKALPRLIPLLQATYGGFFCHRAVYERIGLPNRDLYLYADDTELTARLTAMGGSIFLVTDSPVEDLEPAWSDKDSFGSSLGGWLCGASDLRAFYSARNRAYLAAQIPDHKLWRAINLRVYLAMLYLLALRKSKMARFRLLREAFRLGRTGKLGPDERFPLP